MIGLSLLLMLSCRMLVPTGFMPASRQWTGIPATPQAWRTTAMPAPMLSLEAAMERHGGH